MLRLTRAAVAGLALCVGLAGCVDDPPDEPDDDPGSPSSDASAPPSPSSPGQTEPDAAYPLAESQLRVGPPELVMGPSTSVDSPLNAITVDGIVRGYVGNVDSVLLEGTSAADLAPTDRVVVRRGDRETDFDWCGAWLDAVVPDERDPDLLRAWYHAEDDCAYLANETHKSIAYAESRDGGLTFTKPRHPDNQVVTSPTGSAAGHHTGRGAPSVLRRGRFLWMYYLNVLPDLSTVTSVARAPVASGGVPGSWRSWTGDGWTGDALGGPAAALDTTVPASSASVHAPTGEVVLLRQNAPSGGVVLQTSRDGIHFTPLPEPIVPYLDEQVRDDWSATDGDQIIGYVSAVGADGSRTWSEEFWLFHMYVFPGDPLRGGRYLVRRKVEVVRAPEEGPWSLVALSSYDAGGDLYATSAPEKDAVPGATLALLLATPAADRRALLECTTGGGDRFVAAGCGETGSPGRLVGYAFTDEQPGTVALLRCAASDGDQYVAAGCAADSREVGPLGFAYPAED